MRIIFMGTPDFAVKSLENIITSDHEVVSVFTRPDKKKGRGKKLLPPPVKVTAEKHSIPVHQPISLKGNNEGEVLETLRGYNADCIVVAAYGAILPPSILELPRYGCINVHASLLPKYRGAAPINRAIMEGETETGVTIMQMAEGLDTGDMLMAEKTLITKDMTASKLHDILAEIGGRLVVNTLDNINNLEPIKQDESKMTYAKMIVKPECEIDFSLSAQRVYDFIRGLADYPCAYTYYNNKRIKVYRSVIGEGGDINGIEFTCKDDEVITLTEVQGEGGKRMAAAEFLRGQSHH